MCYSRRGKVGYRTKGSTRISMKKPGRPTRPSLEEIEQIKTSRLVGLEKQIVQVLVKLRERRSTLVKKDQRNGIHATCPTTFSEVPGRGSPDETCRDWKTDSYYPIHPQGQNWK